MTTVAHFSDIHLGYEAYAARSARGFNQRGEDVARAFNRVATDIIAEDPPLVICSGDVAETPNIPVKYMLAAVREFSRIAGIRPDGTRRQLVVIAGNHDQSRHLRDGCFLDLYASIPGCHIVTSGYRVIEFDTQELSNVVVHALPHDSLRDLKDLNVSPVEGRVNILVAHGVAESSDLFKRAVGREYIIPADLLLEDWEYVALGHWHKQGPVFPLGIPTKNTKAWYAGSVESIDFGDVKGSRVTERGWLSVEVTKGEFPKVTPRHHPVRHMVTLPPISAATKKPEDISKELLDNIKSNDIADAVVRQRITDVPRDLWALVDTASVTEAAKAALHYRVEPMFVKEDSTTADDQPRGLARVGALLQQKVAQDVPEEDRPAVLQMADTLLRELSVQVADEVDADRMEDSGQ